MAAISRRRYILIMIGVAPFRLHHIGGVDGAGRLSFHHPLAAVCVAGGMVFRFFLMSDFANVPIGRLAGSFTQAKGNKENQEKEICQ